MGPHDGRACKAACHARKIIMLNMDKYSFSSMLNKKNKGLGLENKLDYVAVGRFPNFPTSKRRKRCCSELWKRHRHHACVYSYTRISLLSILTCQTFVDSMDTQSADNNRTNI
jgi:hypothetical protein